MMEKIEAKEVVKVLESAINGKEKVIVNDPNYGFSSELSQFKCEIGSYSLSFFVDAGELDYVDEVQCVDGRYSDFDYWTEFSESKKDPLEFLSDDQIEKLVKIFSNVENIQNSE